MMVFYLSPSSLNVAEDLLSSEESWNSVFMVAIMRPLS